MVRYLLAMNRISLKYHTLHWLLAAIVVTCITLSSCIDDSMSTSASDQPTFSTDTVRFGTLFTDTPSPTQRFKVFNAHDKGMNISRIAFIDDPDGIFRLNVDGVSGREFNNVEIRENDSIFVFVEVTLPENGRNIPVDVVAHIQFETNGVALKLPVKASGRDCVRLADDTHFATDASLTADKPYLIAGALVVDEGATLTIEEGAELYFHDDAYMEVHGTLRVEGTAENPVTMTGDRFGFVAATIPYELMSGQWRGIMFAPESSDNHISHASIRNSTEGIVLDHVPYTDAVPSLTIVNTQVRNTKNYVLHAIHSSVVAAGCEFTDASSGIVRLEGGTHNFNHCTLANYYLFTALGGPALQLTHLGEGIDQAEGDDAALPFLSAQFSNSIIYGNGTDISHGDLTDTAVTLRTCVLKSDGSDGDNFIGCLWNTDPAYYTVREQYLFDYRLRPNSPAAGKADPSYISPLTPADRFGTPRDPATLTPGAYQIAPPDEAPNPQNH